MFCDKCGNKITDNSPFCDKCGNKITQNQSMTVGVAQASVMVSEVDKNALIPAPMGKRIVASFIDGFIVLIASPINVIPVAGQIIFLGIAGAYYIYFESQKMGTPGKLLMGLAVVGMDGNKLTVSKAFIRWFVSLWGITQFVALFTEKRRGIHDYAANSIVIPRPVSK
jgi:uncharacterized RDD family membrane protein YckC